MSWTRREAAWSLSTDENAARGSLGRGGGVEASTAAASPAALLPGALGQISSAGSSCIRIWPACLRAVRAAWAARNAAASASPPDLGILMSA
jgi:hypothetical protein